MGVAQEHASHPPTAHHRAARTRLHRPARALDAEVLVAVIELSERYRAPSTSLITGQLARGATVTGAFQAAVRPALRRLRARGQLFCVTYRGTHRWSPAGVNERQPFA